MRNYFSLYIVTNKRKPVNQGKQFLRFYSENTENQVYLTNFQHALQKRMDPNAV